MDQLQFRYLRKFRKSGTVGRRHWRGRKEPESRWHVRPGFEIRKRRVVTRTRRCPHYETRRSKPAIAFTMPWHGGRISLRPVH